MAQNISKFVSIDEYTVVEYIFNRNKTGLKTDDNYTRSDTRFGVGLTSENKTFYYENDLYDYYTSNPSIPISYTKNNGRTFSLCLNEQSNTYEYTSSQTTLDKIQNKILEGVDISTDTNSYVYDTVRIYLVSGYIFDGLAAFQLQVNATNNDGNLTNLTNFTWDSNNINSSKHMFTFTTTPLNISGKYYDKYIEIKVPAISDIYYKEDDYSENEVVPPLKKLLNIKLFSDVYVTCSSVESYDKVTKQYSLSNIAIVSFPQNSIADNFNAFILESNDNDYIEFYGTWNGEIIGNYINDIETNRIPLYYDNNDYQHFIETYGVDARKWILFHDIYVNEILGASVIQTQKFSFTQDSDFNDPILFRPVLKHSDATDYFTITYVCRLTNRMDGTQIVRKTSIGSSNAKKYGMKMVRINVDNIINYKIINS